MYVNILFIVNCRERVEKPRPITVDDLEARPGSPSIMVVQADPSSDGGNSPKENGRMKTSYL